jgi:flavin prenyltransferase
MSIKRRLIVAITGASGAIYGVRALEMLRELEGIETHLIISPAGKRTLIEETGRKAASLSALADVEHRYTDLGASLSSGSFRTLGMLVVPCSVKTLSGIVNCYDDNLVVRAADVCRKEGRRVVLMLRETPLHQGHISLMLRAAESGVILMPPVPAFYAKPKTIEQLVTQTVGRALDLFDLEVGLVQRWTE